MTQSSLLLSVAVAFAFASQDGAAQPDDPIAANRKRSEWIERMKSKDAIVRAEAAMVIGDMRWFAGDCSEALASALVGDPNEKVRENAAQALGKIANPRVAVPALLAALKDSSLVVRSTAARSLGDYGAAAAEATPALAGRLKGTSEWDALAAATALTRIDPTRDDGIRCLVALAREAEDKDARSFALSGLAYELDKPELLKRHLKLVVPLLIEFIQGKGGPEAGDDYQRRMTAADAMSNFGPAAKDAVPPLVAALKDPSKFVRLAAVKALHRIDPNNAGIERTLVSELKVVDPLHPDRFDLMHAVMLAGELGPVAKGAVHELIALIREGERVHVQIREMATYSLGSIGPAAKAALPILTPDLEAKDRTHRFKIARAVLGIDPKNVRALDIVKDMAMKPDRSDGIDLRMEALFLLTEHAGERAAAIRTLTAALKAPGEFEKRGGLSVGGRVYIRRDALQWAVQARCAGILGQCGADAKDAVPALVAALQHHQAWVRIEAVQALEKLDPAALRAAGIK